MNILLDSIDLSKVSTVAVEQRLEDGELVEVRVILENRVGHLSFQPWLEDNFGDIFLAVVAQLWNREFVPTTYREAYLSTDGKLKHHYQIFSHRSAINPDLPIWVRFKLDSFAFEDYQTLYSMLVNNNVSFYYGELKGMSDKSGCGYWIDSRSVSESFLNLRVALNEEEWQGIKFEQLIPLESILSIGNILDARLL